MTQTVIQRYDSSRFKRMPWKNGGGTTTELAIEPSDATLDDPFLWRLSMADVAISGPFSRFDGCDRTLLLLDGDGMRLDIEGREPIHLRNNLEPHRFRGDWTTSGVLLGGPCRDFNVITRRSCCRHRLDVLRGATANQDLPGADIRYLFCIQGHARLQSLELELQASELVRLEGLKEPVRVSTPVNPETVLIFIGIDREPSL
jgi:hypothetical protein